MNQLELNNMATRFIQMQSTEVAAKLNRVLGADAQERAKLVSGPPLHYIHNMAIFDCFAALNAMFLMEDPSPEAVHQYTAFAETLRPRFIDLMEEFQDFQPEESNRADDEHKE